MQNNLMNQQSSYVDLPLDTPIELALKYAQPLAVKGRQGQPLAMFTCADGRKLYVPPTAGNEIAKLDLKPGTPFLLTRTRTSWKAEFPNAPQLQGSARRIKPQPAIRLITDSEALDAPVPEDRRRIPQTQLEDALKTAVTAAAAAEKHGQSIGYAVRFRPEDIRALGITVLIGMQGGRAA